MEKDLKLTDQELMLRVQKGDIEAFEVLYDRYHKPLYHFILGFVKERPLAEDLLQETFLRVLKERKRYRKISRFSTYLYTIGRNLCLDTLKSWERRHLLKDQEEYLEKAVSLSKEPSKILEEAEVSEMVQREIHALPRDQREVLLLSKYIGLSHEEIAQIVESTPAAVKQKAYRALIFLKEKLKTFIE